MNEDRYQNPCKIFLLIRLFLLFALPVVHMGDAELTKDTKRWSDDLSLSPPQVETTQCRKHCIGRTYCKPGSGSECARLWQCDAYHIKNTTAAECVDPKEADGSCYCKSDWCNCPKSLQGIKTLDFKNLMCCSGQSKDGSSFKLGSTAYKEPCGGRIRDNGTEWFNDKVFKYNLLSRLREDCYEWTFKEYGFDGDGICRCQTDYCNCPPDIKEMRKKKSQATKTSSVNLFTWLIFILVLFSSPSTSLLS